MGRLTLERNLTYLKCKNLHVIMFRMIRLAFKIKAFMECALILSITVKSLTEARAFIRIITFSGEGGGRLLEAVVLANYVLKPENILFTSNGRHLIFRRRLAI